MDAIQRVKLRYMKLNDAVKQRDANQVEQARIKVDKEATQRIVRNALGSQIEQDEAKRNTKKNLMSDSESDDDNAAKPGKSGKKTQEKLPASKGISKQKHKT